MRRELFITILLVTVSFSLQPQDIPPFNPYPLIEIETLASTRYPGMRFFLGGQVLSDYRGKYQVELERFHNGLIRESELKEYAKLLLLILNESDNRFNEAIKTYQTRKKVLPSCIQDGMDKLIRSIENGEALKMYWYLANQYQMDNKLTNARYEAWDVVKTYNFQRGWHQEKGMVPNSKDTFYIFTLYLPSYKYYPKDKNKPYRNVLASATFFHELVHLIKFRYPKCFKKLGVEDEEGSTEDAQVKVFTWSLSPTTYKDYYGYETECTYDIVCVDGECVPDCPKKND